MKRVLVLALLVAGAFALVASGGLSTDRVRDAVEPAGAWGPLVFIALGAVGTCAMFPGPVMAGAAGLLFGTAGGTAVAITAATRGAVTAYTIARYVAREEVERTLGDRFAGVRGWVARRGFVAVLSTRVAPGLPNSAINYAMGLTQIPVLAFAAGIAIGWGPKAFAYAALGGSLSDLRSPEALAAVIVLVLMGIAGAVVVGRDVREARSGGADAPRGLRPPGSAAGSSSPGGRSAGRP